MDDGSIELVSVSSTDDSSRLADIFEDGIINSSQSSVSGSLLRSVSLNPFGLDGSLGNDENSGLKSLFEFRDELSLILLDKSKDSERNVDNEDLLLLSLGNSFDFSDLSDADVLKSILEFSNTILNFEESLSDLFLER